MAILYAKCGGPPDNWASLIIKKNGVPRDRVLEVDVLGCWALIDEPDGQGGRIGVKEYGQWTIEEPSGVGYRGKVQLMDKPDDMVVVHPKGGWDEPKDTTGADQNDPGDSDPQPYGYPVFCSDTWKAAIKAAWARYDDLVVDKLVKYLAAE